MFENLRDVRETKNFQKISFLVLVKGAEDSIELEMEDFVTEQTEFSRKFQGLLESRTLFINRWKQLTQPAKPKKSVKSSSGKLSGVSDQLLKESFLGIFDVHVGNMESPEACRLSREVDYEHVSLLERSFIEQDLGQVVLLVGMLKNANQDPKALKTEGAGTLEMLGGNHSRIALQSLLRKGILQCSRVKVNVYKPLGRVEALAIGMQNNLLIQEKRKAVSFMDKVKLMRDCQPAAPDKMTTEEIRRWKDALCIIFRAGDRRTLQTRMSQHLQLARLPEEVFRKVVAANEHKQVSERFFKAMLRIDDTAAYHQCLDVLLSNGMKPFQQKVSEFINSGMARGKKKTEKKTSDNSYEITEDSEDDKHGTIVEAGEIEMSSANEESTNGDKDSDLQEKMLLLERENAALKEEIRTLQASKKRKLDESVEGERPYTRSIGDSVMARWPADKQYYSGKIDKVEVCFIQPRMSEQCQH